MHKVLISFAVGVALAGRLGFAGTTPLALKDEATARKIYVNKCGKCHKFYEPSKYSDAEWQSWLAKMSKKAKLSPREEELLSGYLEQKRRSPTVARKDGAKP